MKVEEAKVERYLHEATHPSDMAWLDPISKWVSADTQLASLYKYMSTARRSATLFSRDSCRKAILDSINMAWTTDKYKNVEEKYDMIKQCEK